MHNLYYIQILVILLISTTQLFLAESCKGCISLDEYNFNKIITRFQTVLVKFDVAYPYGDKHDIYTKLAEEFTDNKELLLAEVGVKDYGEKENEKLAVKYGINTKEDLPAIRLFIQDKEEPIVFPKSDSWTLQELKSFIRDNTNFYIGLPGCLEYYDKLAMKFSESTNKQAIIKEATKNLKSLTEEEEKKSGKIYVKFMEKILENSTQFIQQELARLGKILKEGKMNEKKKQELSYRLNILQSFTLQTKDEL